MLKLLVIAAVAFAGVECVPSWSSTYTVKAVLNIPFAELSESFQGWYDGENKRSRVDYYDGLSKTYQLSSNGDFGVHQKVVPFTTDDVLNEITCFQTNGTSDNPVTPQSVLPDLTDFVYLDTEIINNIAAEKWSLTVQIVEKQSIYTIWLFYITDPYNSNANITVPLRYEMYGYNTLLGSHYDHYYVDYNYFSTDKIDDEIFVVDVDKPCRSFPGPGINHLATFNPIREFIHPTVDDHVHEEFEAFKSKHDKVYLNPAEHLQRKELFRQNLRFINSKNRAGLGYTLAVNRMADRTDAEIKALLGKQKSQGYNGGLPFPYDVSKEDPLPDYFDWRLYGAVTPVKDQTVCGSCWSFGTVGTIEGAYFLKNKVLLRLSEQALVDCSWAYGNNGCDGGEDFRAYQWIMEHGGIPTDLSYGPYLGEDGYCHFGNATLAAAIDSYVNVTLYDETALKTALIKQGPISVGIDASAKEFLFYSNGVLHDIPCGNSPDVLNHAVLAVGYGTLDDKKYWLIKNSWSIYWGNEGYVLLGIDGNTCGVMSSPTYVNLKDNL